MVLDNLTKLELHDLLYKVVDKLNSTNCVYDKKLNKTHNDYFASNKTWHYDARTEIAELVETVEDSSIGHVVGSFCPI